MEDVKIERRTTTKKSRLIDYLSNSEDGLTVYELAKLLDMSPEQVQVRISTLRKESYNVVTIKGFSDGRVKTLNKYRIV